MINSPLKAQVTEQHSLKFWNAVESHLLIFFFFLGYWSCFEKIQFKQNSLNGIIILCSYEVQGQIET